MDASRFWVIGSEYTDTAFDRIIEGTQSLLGPFLSYEDARSTWREQSQATRYNAHMRFTIVAEPSTTSMV